MKKQLKSIVLKIDIKNPELEKIKTAAQVIRQGGLVAFPTETVYGLGADGLNYRACIKIFKVKRRPRNIPLILHIAQKRHLFNLARRIPTEAQKLIARFWPGPLTLVLEKSNIVPPIVTGGSDTVAIRMPKNLIALNLIKYAQTPVAAPSANLFGCPSPTCAQHVIDDLGGKVDVIIDGGKTEIGVESTILNLTCKPFMILRPGGVTEEDLKKVLGKIEPYSDRGRLEGAQKIFPQSYFSQTELVLIEEKEGQIKEMKKLALRFRKEGKIVGIMVTEENRNEFDEFIVKIMGSKNDLKTCAFNLFPTLRSFDKEKVDIIIAQGAKLEGIGLTIMNRLRKVASRKVIQK